MKILDCCPCLNILFSECMLELCWRAEESGIYSGKDLCVYPTLNQWCCSCCLSYVLLRNVVGRVLNETHFHRKSLNVKTCILAI